MLAARALAVGAAVHTPQARTLHTRRAHLGRMPSVRPGLAHRQTTRLAGMAATLRSGRTTIQRLPFLRKAETVEPLAAALAAAARLGLELVSPSNPVATAGQALAQMAVVLVVALRGLMATAKRVATAEPLAAAVVAAQTMVRLAATVVAMEAMAATDAAALVVALAE